MISVGSDKIVPNPNFCGVQQPRASIGGRGGDQGRTAGRPFHCVRFKPSLQLVHRVLGWFLVIFGGVQKSTGQYYVLNFLNVIFIGLFHSRLWSKYFKSFSINMYINHACCLMPSISEKDVSIIDPGSCR